MRALFEGLALLVSVISPRPELLAALPPDGRTAPPDTFELSVPSIMRGPEIVGREPTRVRWSADGQWIYFEWLPPGSSWREPLAPHRVRARPGATPERVTEAHMDSVAALVETGPLSPDGKFRVVSANGDLFLIDVKRATARRLTRTQAAETDPGFSIDGRRVFFTRDENLFELDLASGEVRQLTDLRRGPRPPADSTPKGQRGFLQRQNERLIGAVRDRLWQDSVARARREAHEGRGLPKLYLGKDERFTQWFVSPAGNAALLLVRVPAGDKTRIAQVPNYVARSGYTEELAARTKVGDAQDGLRLGFVRLGDSTIKWLRPIPSDSVKAPSSIRVYGWNDAGTAALVMAVSSDFKIRLIQRVDADAGRMALVDSLRDEAWIGGPCSDCGGWMPGGDRVWFVSEADGWAHLYTAKPDGSDRRQLTSGKWEVLDAGISEDRKWFELHTSEVSVYERRFYRMPLSGGPRELITTAVGGHTVVVSPDGTMLADVYSEANRPPELFLLPYRPGAPMSRLTTSPTSAWLSYPWLKPDIVAIPASDGVRVPARIYRPEQLGAKPNGAGVIFVHGAGYLHNVHQYWSSYFREYMFHHLLASKGYVVLDIDYRGSAGYGRDWRTAIYRHMGGRDLQDQVDGSRYLQQEFGISPDKVGIYGGSYGGFITLMALFTEAKQFGAGAALRAVTDWAHYNHPYTGRILNLPQDDSVAYQQSSPIYFAEGLEDPLLIAHGMADVNVHFQDVVRLSQRLIELGKTNWELAVYPVEDHGFVRPDSWTDEYRRILELFDKRLR